MGFRFDMRDKTPQQQAIASQRDRQNKLLREQASNNNDSAHRKICKTAIFMRLGIDESSGYDGINTMENYKKFCSVNSSVWFSTDALYYGMAKGKVKYFRNAIRNNEVVYMYFAIGKKGNGNNNIAYRSEVLGLESHRDRIESPERTLTPDEWKNDRNKIWIKVENIIPYTELATKDFKVESSNYILADSIEHSEYHFGYIIRA